MLKSFYNDDASSLEIFKVAGSMLSSLQASRFQGAGSSPPCKLPAAYANAPARQVLFEYDVSAIEVMPPLMVVSWTDSRLQ